MPIKVEKKGNITIIIIDNPEVRNAIDGESANQLAKAFRDYDSDPNAKVAILCGSGDNFCSGANLKAIDKGTGNKIERDGDGPM